MKKHFITIILIALFFKNNAQVKILFDARKAESAGNADWVIDADVRNLYFSNTGGYSTFGTQSNAQRFPTPAQSGITSSSSETYWDGGISALAVDMAKLGYQVESLPYNVAITYSNSSNPQDLSNYKIYVVCEPNIVFNSTEKTAIMNFVKNGGSLFMISDHRVSDRNFDGWDSPQIWTDLMNNNSVQNNAFGIMFDTAQVAGNFSGTFNYPSTNVLDSLTHGPGGTCTQVKWSGGTRMTLNPSQNASVVGDFFRYSPGSGNTDVLMAHARFFNGKVAAIGDSSPLDDATGDPGDVLYNGYFTDAAGNHQKLLINTMVWLAQGATSAVGVKDYSIIKNSITLYPNPSSNFINIITTETINSFEIINYLGQKINVKMIDSKIDVTDIDNGCYIFRIFTDKGITLKKFIKTNN